MRENSFCVDLLDIVSSDYHL